MCFLAPTRRPGRARLLAPLVLLLAPIVALASFASPASAGEIRDDAGFFDKDTVQRARNVVNQIQQKNGVNVVVETYAEIPADLKAKYDDAHKDQFYEDWRRCAASRSGRTS